MVSSFYITLTSTNNQLTRYEVPFVLILGNLGNLMNIIIFSRQALRINACSMYFICLSFAHLILLDTHGIPRVVAAFMGSDASRQINAYCKARLYCLTLGMIFSRHFICLISIDRWLVSSPDANLRQKSSSRLARWLIIASVTFWTIFSIHAPIGFSSAQWGCSPVPRSAYALFYSFYSIVSTLLTLIIMIMFSVLTLINVRGSVRRLIHPSSHSTTNRPHQPSVLPIGQQHEQRSKRDTQLVRLSILQVIIYIVLNATWTAYPLASFITDSLGSFVYGNDTEAIISFLGNFGMNLLYIYASSTFILYTMASSTFRKECWQLVKRCLRHFH